MSISKSLSQDLAHEATIARRLLEIVPENQMDWKPVDTAMSLSRLAGHVAQILGWIRPIMSKDGWDLEDKPLYEPAEPSQVRHLLVEFGTQVGDYHQLLREVSDEELNASWTLRRGATEIETMTRAAAIHRFILSHLAHHCGQLSVYLWMLGVAVPTIYQPTDDHRDHTVKESEYDRSPSVAEEAMAVS